MSQYALGLICVNCHAQFPFEPMVEGCPACRSEGFLSGLTVAYDYGAIRANVDWGSLRGEGIWKYRELLPLEQPENEITLHEGNTPLVECRDWVKELGLRELYLKDESRNPTWSFKDRLCAVAVSKALDFGVQTVAISSSGNHGASTAAYAAPGGLACVVFTYHGISDAMKRLIQMYGAHLYVTTFEGRWQLLKEGMRRYGWLPTGNITSIPSCTPYGHEGYKTIAYEICEQRRWQCPDVVIIPSGYSEGLYGVWKGFRELHDLGLINRTPRMVAVEPEKRAALNRAYVEGNDGIATVNTDATAARGIGASTNSYIGYAALKESGGVAVAVSDEEALEAQAAMGRTGLYVEPASASVLAALRKLAIRRAFSGDEVVVCINTSSGLKGPEGRKGRPVADVAPDFPSLLEASSRLYGLKEGEAPFTQ